MVKVKFLNAKTESIWKDENWNGTKTRETWNVKTVKLK